MMWVELAEWAEGNWPPGKELRPEKSDDGADRGEEFRFASQGRQDTNRIKS
jgi:hypothetical protein